MAADAVAVAVAPATAPAITTTNIRFADSFWDDNDRGVSILTDKFAIATQTCNEIQSLYEIRAQIEEDYGDRLLKLSQMMIGDAEDGTFAESISHVPTAIEITARAHVDLAHQLRQQLQAPLLGFMKDFDEKRNTQAQQIEETKESRSKHHANMLKAKDRYTAEYTKMLGMKKYIFERHREMAPTEVHQIEEEIEDQKKQVASAEKEYKNALDILNNATRKWVNDWQSSCDLYQFMEEDRMNFVRNSLWAFANVMSSVYVVDDQCCERIRSALELTDVQRDLETFVENNKTGSQIPEPIPFDDLSNLTGGAVGASARAPQPLPPTATISYLPSALPSSPSPPSETIPPAPALADPTPPVTRTQSDDTVARDDQQSYKPLVRTLSDPHAREQTYGSIPMMTIHNDSNRRYSNRDSLTDSSPGFDFVDHAEPAATSTVVAAETPDKPQSDAMSTAFREIETMLDDVGSAGIAAALPPLPQLQPQPQIRSIPVGKPVIHEPVAGASDLPVFSSVQAPMPASAPAPMGAIVPIMAPVPTAPVSAPTPVPVPVPVSVPAPAPAPLMSGSMSTPLPRKTGVTRLVGRNEPRPISSVASAAAAGPSSSPPDPARSSTIPDLENANRLKPIPNPAFEPGTMAVQQTPSYTATQPMLTPGIDEEESEDEFPPMRRASQKPREEKWMISTLRRPQQLPVMSQNARIYDRQSVSVTDLRINTTVPAYGSSLFAANNNANRMSTIAEVRSQLRQQPSPTLTEDSFFPLSPQAQAQPQPQSQPQPQPISVNVLQESSPTTIPMNPGIRSAPWQSAPVAEPRSELYQRGGLHRQGSVNGPRQRKVEPSLGSEAYSSPTPFTPQQQRTSKSNKKGNRFSRAFFGKKWTAKDDDTVPEVPKLVHQPEPSQPHAESPEKQDDVAIDAGLGRLADGKPILRYARAIWDYEAKIATELSFRSGDLFAVIRVQQDGWWEAELTDPARQNRGLIPGNYMES